MVAKMCSRFRSFPAVARRFLGSDIPTLPYVLSPHAPLALPISICLPAGLELNEPRDLMPSLQTIKSESVNFRRDPIGMSVAMVGPFTAVA